MDDRQRDITEGAGLEESRVNKELLDFLNKWSVPVLFLILIVSLGYMGLNFFQQQRLEARDVAFAEYTQQVETAQNPLPEAVADVAEAHEDAGSVAELARLRLGEIYLRAALTGLEPGAQLDQQGNPENEDDVLDQDDRERYARSAADAFRRVIDRSTGQAGKPLLAINALFGLAATTATLGDREAAADEYERAASLAEANGFERLALIARGRAQDLPTWPEVPPLSAMPTRDALPRFPGEPAPASQAPEPSPAGEPEAIGPPAPGGLELPFPGGLETPGSPLELPSSVPPPAEGGGDEGDSGASTEAGSEAGSGAGTQTGQQTGSGPPPAA